MKKPVIILGFGGHGHVVADLVRRSGYTVLGYTAPEEAVRRGFPNDPDFLGNDDVIRQYETGNISLANGMGSVGHSSLRGRIFIGLVRQGYHFPALQHPSAIIADNVRLAEGSQVMAGAVLQSGVSIGQNSIINTRVSIDHDCLVKDHVHIAPGSVLSGDVTVESHVHIGTGAVVIQGITIGRAALVGAGATVLSNIPDDSLAIGTPAIFRPRKEKNNSKL